MIYHSEDQPIIINVEVQGTEVVAVAAAVIQIIQTRTPGVKPVVVVLPAPRVVQVALALTVNQILRHPRLVVHNINSRTGRTEEILFRNTVYVIPLISVNIIATIWRIPRRMLVDNVRCQRHRRTDNKRTYSKVRMSNRTSISNSRDNVSFLEST